MCVAEARNWRSQLPFAVLARVSIYEYACTCAGVGKQSAVTVPATAIALTCFSKPRSALSWVLLRCLCVALVVTIARGEHCACVSAHTHICVL